MLCLRLKLGGAFRCNPRLAEGDSSSLWDSCFGRLNRERYTPDRCVACKIFFAGRGRGWSKHDSGVSREEKWQLLVGVEHDFDGVLTLRDGKGRFAVDELGLAQ